MLISLNENVVTIKKYDSKTSKTKIISILQIVKLLINNGKAVREIFAIKTYS